jgi:hypothetical protein
MSARDEPRPLDEVLAEHLSVDGPHSADTVIGAAGGVSALVRYLNHATRSPSRLNGPQLYHAVGLLTAAAHGLVQLLGQLHAIADHVAGDPTLYDDRRDRPASQTAGALADVLDQAARAVSRVTAPLDAAHSLSCHLGHDRPRKGRAARRASRQVTP